MSHLQAAGQGPGPQQRATPVQRGQRGQHGSGTQPSIRPSVQAAHSRTRLGLQANAWPCREVSAACFVPRTRRSGGASPRARAGGREPSGACRPLAGDCLTARGLRKEHPAPYNQARLQCRKQTPRPGQRGSAASLAWEPRAEPGQNAARRSRRVCLVVAHGLCTSGQEKLVQVPLARSPPFRSARGQAHALCSGECSSNPRRSSSSNPGPGGCHSSSCYLGPNRCRCSAAAQGEGTRACATQGSASASLRLGTKTQAMFTAAPALLCKDGGPVNRASHLLPTPAFRRGLALRTRVGTAGEGMRH